MDEIIVFQQAGSGAVKISGIRQYGSGLIISRVFDLPAQLPDFIDSPEEYFREDFSGDLVLSFLSHPDLLDYLAGDGALDRHLADQVILQQYAPAAVLTTEIGEQRDYSDSVAEEIDAEVRRIVGEAHQKSHNVMQEHLDRLHQGAKKLIEVETIDSKDFEALMAGTTPPAVTPPAAPSAPRTPQIVPPDISTPTLDMPPSPALA